MLPNHRSAATASNTAMPRRNKRASSPRTAVRSVPAMSAVQTILDQINGGMSKGADTEQRPKPARPTNRNR